MEKLPRGIVKLSNGNYAVGKETNKGYNTFYKHTERTSVEEALEQYYLMQMRDHLRKAEKYFAILQKKYPKEYGKLTTLEMGIC